MAIDRAALDKVIEINFAGDWDIFATTAQCFLDSLEENMQAFKEALDSKDTVRITKTAHRLKGESSLFHDLGASELLKVVEHKGRQNELTGPETFGQIRQAIDKLADELRSVL